MKISVCIVEDNGQIRSCLEQLIKMDKHYLLKGSFSNAENALQKSPVIRPVYEVDEKVFDPLTSGANGYNSKKMLLINYFQLLKNYIKAAPHL